MNNRIRHGASQCLAVVLSAMLIFSTAVMVYAGAPDVPIGTISPDTSNWSSENAAVNFTIPQYTVTASPCANGSVIVGKNQTYATDTVTVTATPATNYELNYIAVNGANIGKATSFEMPPRNTSVQVYFKESAHTVVSSGSMHFGYSHSDDSGSTYYDSNNTQITATFSAGVYTKAEIEMYVTTTANNCGETGIWVNPIGGASQSLYSLGGHNSPQRPTNQKDTRWITTTIYLPSNCNTMTISGSGGTDHRYHSGSGTIAISSCTIKLLP